MQGRALDHGSRGSAVVRRVGQGVWVTPSPNPGNTTPRLGWRGRQNRLWKELKHVQCRQLLSMDITEAPPVLPDPHD